jgi:hypothetical protein
MILIEKKFTLISAAIGGNKIAKIDKRILLPRSPMTNLYSEESQRWINKLLYLKKI